MRGCIYYLHPKTLCSLFDYGSMWLFDQLHIQQTPTLSVTPTQGLADHSQVWQCLESKSGEEEPRKVVSGTK